MDRVGVALAFRASEIMMRLNAPVTAILALAALLVLPANCLAKPSHHHAHGTPGTVARHRSAAARTTHTASHHPAVKTRVSPVADVHKHHAASHHHARHAIISVTPSV